MVDETRGSSTDGGGEQAPVPSGKEATGVVSPVTGRVQVKDTRTGQVSFVEKGSIAETEAVSRASEETQVSVSRGATSPGQAKRIIEEQQDIKAFAEKHGMSVESAKETLARFKADPTSPEFSPLTTEEQKSLIEVAKPTEPIVQYPDYRGQTVIVSEKAVKRLVTLSGEERFGAMQSLRIMPKDAVFIPSKTGTAYLTGDKAQEFKKQSPVLYNVLITAGAEAMEAEAKRLGVELATEARMEAPIRTFAQQQGMSLASAEKTIARYKDNPASDEFKPLSAVDIYTLNIASGRKEDTNLIVIGKDMMTVKAFNEMPQKYRSLAVRQNSFTAMSEAWEADLVTFESDHRKLSDGYIKNTDYNELPKSLQAIADSEGFAGIDKHINRMSLVSAFINATAEQPILVRKDFKVSRDEIYDVIKPEDMSPLLFEKMKPYISDSGRVDTIGAIQSGKVEDIVVQRVSQLSDEQMEEQKWYAKYDKAGLPEKLAMSAKKDPGEFAKVMALSAVPVAGTMAFWKEMPTWMKAVSIVGDILIVAPIVTGISAGVKGGMSLSRATVVTGRGLLTSPITTLRHPIQTLKAMVEPIETLLIPKKLPLAAIWRGEYAPMGVMKVGAGQVPLATREGMAELSRLATLGKDARITTATGEVITYSATGLQKILGPSTVTATPYGSTYLAGVKATEPIFTSPSGLVGLTGATATGKTAKYVAKGKNIVGDIGKLGQVLGKKGEVIGYVKEGTKVRGLKNEVIGLVDINGAVVKDGKVIASIVEGGVAVDKTNKAIGWIPDGAKLVSKADRTIVIGKAKSLPTFAIIRTQGVTKLPQYILDSPNMATMERKAEQAFKAGTLDPNLFEVFKQYKKWIEFENVYPTGTRLIPVIGKNGKPVVLSTRGIGGEKIAVPILQEVSPGWFARSLEYTKQLSGVATAGTRNINLGKVVNIPKGANKPILQWLRKNPDSTIYGSLSEYIQGGRYIPNDIDLAVKSPLRSANELADILRANSKSSVKVLETIKDNYAVKILKDGIWQTAIDIHPVEVLSKSLPHGLKPSPPIIVDGIKMEALGTQAKRLLLRADEQWGVSALRLSGVGKKLGVNLPMGFGAKPPNLIQLYALKAKGFYNIVRDIFVKGLTKEKRIQLVKSIAPDLAPDVARLIAKEKQIANLGKTLRARAGSKLKPKELNALIKKARAEERALYNELAKRLGVELRARAGAMNKLMTAMPVAYNRLAQRRYDELVATTRGIATVRARPPRISAPRTVGRPVAPKTGRVTPLKEIERMPGRLPTPRKGLTPVRTIRAEKVPAPERLVTGIRKTGEPPRKPTPPRKTPIERPPRKPPTERPPRKPPPPPPVLMPDRVAGESRRKIPDGSLAWAQGQRRQGKRLVNQWYYIPPPFMQRKPISLSAPPIGAKNMHNIVPRETIQVIGKSQARIPQRVDVDLGWADITVVNGREISFRSGGEETNVGARIDSPTIGMDMGAEYFDDPLYPSRPITRKIKKPPKPRPANNRRRDDATTLTGIKK